MFTLYEQTDKLKDPYKDDKMWVLSQEKNLCIPERSSDCLLQYVEPQLKMHVWNHIAYDPEIVFSLKKIQSIKTQLFG